MAHHKEVDVQMRPDLEAAYTAEPAPKPVWSATIANPAPLGLLAFGMTTFFLMSVDTLWSGKAFVGAVIGYAYAYGGFAQMVAGVLEVRSRGIGIDWREGGRVGRASRASRATRCRPAAPHWRLVPHTRLLALATNCSVDWT